MLVKHLIVKTLSKRPLLWLGDKLFPYSVPIFMLHRFSVPNEGVDGHDLWLLRNSLEFLRKRNFNLVALEDVVKAVREEEPLPPRSIAFTLDDGFWDQVEIGADIFAKYDCAATYFVTTGYINKEVWFWDSKIDFLISAASVKLLPNLSDLFPRKIFVGKSSPEIVNEITWILAEKPLVEINATLDKMAEVLDVELPFDIPGKYRPATWDQLVAIEKSGMKIAPHSVRHPILSNETDEDSEWEIRESSKEIKSRLKNPSNIFCYPVGRKQDFGRREEEICKNLKFDGAVSAFPPAVDQRMVSELYRLPRFGFPNNIEDMVQYCSWIESVKDKLRS